MGELGELAGRLKDGLRDHDQTAAGTDQGWVEVRRGDLEDLIVTAERADRELQARRGEEGRSDA